MIRSDRSLILRVRPQDSAARFVGKRLEARSAPVLLTTHPPPGAGTTWRDFVALVMNLRLRENRDDRRDQSVISAIARAKLSPSSPLRTFSRSLHGRFGFTGVT